MKCPKCNTNIASDQIKFCPKCGQKLDNNKIADRREAPAKKEGTPVKRTAATPVQKAAATPAKKKVEAQTKKTAERPVKKTPVQPQKPQKSILLPAILIAVLLLALAGGSFVATKVIMGGNSNNSKTADSRVEERDADNDDEDDEDKDKEDQKDKDREREKDQESASETASSSVAEEKDSKESEKTDKEVTEEKEAVAFVPEEDEKEEKKTDADKKSGSDAAASYTPDESESDEDVLCSYSSSRLLTKEDYNKLLAEHNEIFPGNRGLAQMMQNEIYARHAYIFTAQELNDYFGQFQWYRDACSSQSTSNDQSVIVKRFSSIEKANVDFLETCK